MTKTRLILHFSVVVALALGAGACQTISDLDPTGLIGGDEIPAPASQFPDAAAPQASDATQTTPDLASLPPAPVSTPAAQQQQTAQAVTAAGTQAQYSADALRGGTEAAAPAPGAADAAPLPQVASANPPPTAANPDAPPSTDAAPTTDAAPSAEAPMAAAPTTEAALPVANPNAAVPSAPLPTATMPSAPVQTASAEPPASPPPMASPVPGAEPAVPANTPIRGAGTGGGIASDASLGFQPSQAPPLNASISEWVPAPIVARYRQTASNAGIATPSAMAAVPTKGSMSGMGGPDMSGAVVANLGAIPTGPASVAAVNGGDAPTAVVYFPGDGTSLSAAARSEIRGAVQAFKANGGAGTVRVIGHASSRTANMPVEKHLELIFDKSQARANAVAQELIHQGVPADKVLVEAVGDSQPVYYESMPKGEDGNRRADIFVQS